MNLQMSALLLNLTIYIYIYIYIHVFEIIAIYEIEGNLPCTVFLQASWEIKIYIISAISVTLKGIKMHLALYQLLIYFICYCLYFK